MSASLHGNRLREGHTIEYRHSLLPNRKVAEKVARFRQINMDNPNTHHEALEFPNGQIVLLDRLCEGQRATVLQLPAVRGACARRRRRRATFASPNQPARFHACAAVQAKAERATEG